MPPLSPSEDVLATGTWVKTPGYVLAGNGTTYEKDAIGEPEVLTPDPAGVAQMRMFYSGGWDVAAVHSAVSNDDGLSWTRVAGNPVIGQGAGGEPGMAAHHGVVQAPDGSVHVIYSANVGANNVPLYAVKSTDNGLTFGNRRVILNAAGWEIGTWGNTDVHIDDAGVWHMLYECMDSAHIWQAGYATSPDGITWTRQNGGQPITTLRVGSGMYGGMNLHKQADGSFEVFYHASVSGNLPTDIYRAVSTDLIHWERRPGHPILTRSQSYEVDQVADPCMVEIAGERVLFYSGVDNTPNPGHMRMGRAVYHPELVNPARMLGADKLHPNDAGMTHLADAYVAALEAAGKTPAAGTTLYAYGDSWTASDIQNTPGKRAVVQLAARLGLTLTNRAVSGDYAADCANRAVGLNPYAAGTPGTVLLAAGFNDLGHADTPAKRAMVATNLRALFAAVCAAERIEQSANTGTTGTWTAGAPATASGGSNLATTQDGATMTFNITTPGTYYLHSHVTSGAAGWVGGVLTVSQGGTTLATFDLNAQHIDTVNATSSSFGPGAVRIPGVVAGPLTVTFSTAGRAGAQGWVDCLTRKGAGPTVLAAKPVQVAYEGYAKPNLLAYIRSLYDTLAAEFGSNVVVVDPTPGWWQGP